MMATFFNAGSEIQADNLQTLYLMNRGGGGGYAAYSDAGQSSPDVLLLNPAGASSQNQTNALALGTIHHAPNLLSQHHHRHLVGIPLSGPSSPAGDDPSLPSLHEISGHQLVPRFHYNLWGAVSDPSPSSSGHHTHIPTAVAVRGGGDLGSPMGFRHPAQGGLSLSLNNSSPHNNVAVLSPGNVTTMSASGVKNMVAGGGSPGVILGSKYLKAAQELLDEAVNVGKAIRVADGSKDKAKAAVGAGEGSSGGGGGGVESGGGKGGGVAAELTTAQRQELQMKKAKLVNMLDEVEQRYRQYQRQMQGVAAALEQAAGPEPARSYTALALQTISRQFRCLKYAIGTQIKATGRSLGEELEDEQGRLGEGSRASRSRLRMVDNQVRQHRAFQQLGMMHHNAWRPQRGLPERAVSILRAWLFEHFLHPYPKDSDKHTLAKQTGLTRSQVSNWFINARVRLWKPMVEEMYLEETKSQEQQNPSGSDVHPTTTATATATTPKSTPSALHFNQNPHPIPTANDITNPSLLSPNNSSSTGRTTTLHSAIGPLQGFSIVGSSETDPKRHRLFPSDVIHNLNSSSPSSILTSSMDHDSNNKADIKDFGGFGYPIGDIGSRFNPDHHQLQYHHGNAVSLTLGLPHCDQNLTLAGTHHQNYQAELCGIDTSHQPPHSSAAYDVGGINDVQNRASWRSTLI